MIRSRDVLRASVSNLRVPGARAHIAAAALAALVASPQAWAAGAPEGLRPVPPPPDAPAIVPAEICFTPELLDDASADDAEGPDALDEDIERAADGVDGATSDADPDAADAPEAAGVDPEAEAHDQLPVPGDGTLRYSADLSDAELKARWQKAPETLGSMSIGFTDAGRVINAVPFPKDGNWIVVDPRDSWGTRETIDFIVAAIEQVSERIPGTPPLRVNDISSREGGWLRGHRSHQSGRDVDLGFYYPTAEPIRIRARETCIDVARNWALVRALVTTGDVQSILVDKRVQAVLYRYALSIGEDKAWLDSLFHGGPDALVKHARRHRDHFHVRFHNGRSQELGRRIQPLLAARPEHNVTTHKVRRGDTLGHIAKRYGTSVGALKKKNGLRSTFLRLGRILTVPMRGPCTQCPLPPPVVVPPRRLPPDVELGASPVDDPGAPIALDGDITPVAPVPDIVAGAPVSSLVASSPAEGLLPARVGSPAAPAPAATSVQPPTMGTASVPAKSSGR